MDALKEELSSQSPGSHNASVQVKLHRVDSRWLDSRDVLCHISLASSDQDDAQQQQGTATAHTQLDTHPLQFAS